KLTPVVGTVRALGEALSYAAQSSVRAGGGLAGMRAGFRTFTGSAGTAAAAAGKFRSAASGLYSFLGGPWGIALMGAAALVGSWISSNREAERAVQAHTDAIIANEGALGESNKELIATALEAEGVLQAADKLGVSLELVTEAALGNADAQRELDAILSGHIS